MSTSKVNMDQIIIDILITNVNIKESDGLTPQHDQHDHQQHQITFDENESSREERRRKIRRSSQTAELTN